MDWVITIGAIATAWAAATIIGGERQYRLNAILAKQLEEEANKAAAEAAAAAAAAAALTAANQPKNAPAAGKSAAPAKKAA